MPQKITDSGFKDWTPDLLPDLSGKTYVITGGNAGIGYEAAKYLGEKGGRIILACRSEDKARVARDVLAKETGAKVDYLVLDLSSLTSVKEAAQAVRDNASAIDGLINNAGIMQTPPQKTKDGFEMQLGTNHLGHFLWTGLLLDLVEAASGRVVTVSSIAHKYGQLHFDDLMLEQDYTATKAYTQSKLANLVFALELDRRLKAHGKNAISIACHPGYSSTQLQSTGPSGVWNFLYKFLNPLMAQPASNGAIPTVLAAAGKEAQRGAYYGPQKMREARGPVSDAEVASKALNEEDARRLWTISEELVGLSYLN